MANIPIQKLEKLETFQELLEDYKPSLESIELLKACRPVLLVGPTAAGRNSLINLLVDTGRYRFVVSDTTRKPRTNNGIIEQDGREYWFKSEDEFIRGLREGKYLEASIIHEQQVSGMSLRELQIAKQEDKTPINEIEPVGAKNIATYSSNVLFVFLLPPSFDVWMQRLRGRGDIDEDEVIRRLRSAIKEIDNSLNEEYYQFVINNEIHDAAQAVDELANGREPDEEKQQKGRNHAEQLAVEVQLYLDSL